ncbi:Transposon Tf2-12 polyprotein [Sesamum angolense]|uniref:Transposon Tf2-12 polyprotein n=1 Tax=Sesamum angolense TaxID=2727404 RepID=A0AAE1WQH0_9LAMI|nr:Transposon Tf2-12 polyprotein [Sesamum angolense]
MEHNKIKEEEVEKLLRAGYVAVVQYMEWLSNVVVVPQAAGKWRMCTDFTDLNKAARMTLIRYPRSTCWWIQLLDAPYLVLHIKGLLTKCSRTLLAKTMDVYIDDMLVKSKKETEHLNHLQAAFEVIKRYGMKLNPAKCTFGVKGGKFLGYMVSEKGIKVNPKKIKAITKMGSPKTIKDVQKLTGETEQQRRGGWMLHVDGSSTSNAGGTGVLLQGPEGIEIEVAIKLDFPTTNNEAEYEALTIGLEIALKTGVK